MAERAIGELLDGLGLRCDLREGDLIQDALVIFRSSNFEDGETRVGVAYTTHTDLVVRRGLVELLKDFEEMTSVMTIDTDDDEED